MSPKEIRLLTLLIDSGSHVVPREEIIKHVWSNPWPKDPNNNLKVLICKANFDLEQHGIKINNIVSVGYGIDPKDHDRVREIIADVIKRKPWRDAA